jgi:hypothetical protein
MAVSPAMAIETGFSIYPIGMVGFMSSLLPAQPGICVTGTYYHFGGSAGSGPP